LDPGEEEVDDNTETAFVDGFTTCPKKFPIRFNQSSREHKEIIKKEIEAANLILERYERVGRTG
jgi:ribosomal protein L16/L10AE